MRLKQIIDYIYDVYMKWRGYEPYGWNFKTNKKMYEKRSVLDQWEKENEQS